MTASSLPPWLQYLQALSLVAIPFVGLIITGLGAWIALQQMRIARMKLDHDRYERRLRIFEASHALLSEAIVKETVSDATLKVFFVETVVAPFHFDDGVVEYLQRLGTVASSVRVTNQALADETDAKSRAKLAEDGKRDLLWLQQELQSGTLVNRFRRDLALDATRG